MAYNLKLAERIRAELDGMPFVERKMFGGVSFLIGGNMACGVHKEGLIVRVDPDKHANLVKKPHARVFDMTGRPMKGWLVVDTDGYKTPNSLPDKMRIME